MKKYNVAILGATGAVGREMMKIGAHKGADGQTHVLGEIAGENVAEIAGGHHEIDGFAHGDASGLHQVGVGVPCWSGRSDRDP